MSVVSDIYDAAIALIAATLTTYARMPNPYSPDENTALILKRAYGLAIGPGTNTERYVGCIASWEREFTIVLVKQVVNTENDTLGRAAVEIDIDEDRDSILLAFENDSTLGAKCIKAVITGDSGIQYINGTQSNFLAVEITLRVEYQQSL